MTSFRFHTNFTNPLKITNLATSPTKSNCPKLLFIPQHRRAGFSRRCLSSTVTDVVVLEVKLLQTSIGLKAFSQGLANSCRGETGGIHPFSPTWLRTEHTSENIYGVQCPKYRTGGRRPPVKTTISLQPLNLLLGKFQNSHFQDLPIQGLKNWQKKLQKYLLKPAACRSRDASAPWSPILLQLR